MPLLTHSFSVEQAAEPDGSVLAQHSGRHAAEASALGYWRSALVSVVVTVVAVLLVVKFELPVAVAAAAAMADLLQWRRPVGLEKIPEQSHAVVDYDEQSAVVVGSDPVMELLPAPAVAKPAAAPAAELAADGERWVRLPTVELVALRQWLLEM